MESYKDFETRMHSEYPVIFSEKYGGFAIGAGWYPLVEELVACIDTYIRWQNRDGEKVKPVIAKQIKEKFGGLRFYYEGGDEYINGLSSMAEQMSYRICEECGANGRVRNGGWIRTLCDAHEAERQEKLKERFEDV